MPLPLSEIKLALLKLGYNQKWRDAQLKGMTQRRKRNYTFDVRY